MSSLIFLAIVGMIIYAFRDELFAAAAFIGTFMAVGALIFWIIFDNASLGASIGFWFAIFLGFRIILEKMGAEYANIFEYAIELSPSPFGS